MYVHVSVCWHVIYLPAEYIVEAHTDRERGREKGEIQRASEL